MGSLIRPIEAANEGNDSITEYPSVQTPKHTHTAGVSRKEQQREDRKN